jgi:hypothetical protein
MDTATVSTTNPTVTTIPTKPDKLAGYITTIKSEYRQAKQGQNDWITHAIKCGEAMNLARREVGESKWPKFRKEHFSDMSDRTFRYWRKWADPVNKEKIEAATRQRVADLGDGSLTYREINKIVGDPEAQKAKADRLRAAQKIRKSFAEEINGLDVPKVIETIGRVLGAGFLDELREELTKRHKAEMPDLSPALDRQQSMKQRPLVT